MIRTARFATLLGLLLLVAPLAAETALTFEYRHLSAEFFCEGAGLGDIDGDGDVDIVSGPYWYEGPEFERVHIIYEPVAVDVARYSKNFFAFVHDLNADGANDVLVIGFPGEEARWYENPGSLAAEWPVHEALRPVDNESATFADLTGDGKPEIVCSQGGVFGYAEPDAEAPTKPWRFRPISETGATGARFTHGLGLGDVDGDGLLDLLARDGWWQQPGDSSEAQLWDHHPAKFADRGGSQMFVRDLDGDGDGDVVSSQNAHGYGLAWFEQQQGKDGREWKRHLIMGSQQADSPFGVRFSQLHAMAMADMDGDGVDDLVTGKRWWAHSGKDPGGVEPPVLYWFRVVPGGESGLVSFEPRQIHADSGVGTGVTVGDADGDGLMDVLVGNKKGTHLHLQRRPEGTAIFDGRSLDGWEGASRWWRVEDGAITGESTEQKKLPSNTFLFWRGGELADFDLRCEFRIGGSPNANSGIQFRCGERPGLEVTGYQADIDGGASWLGSLYDEHGRGQLCKRGVRVVIDEQGDRTETSLATPDVAAAPGEWNRYRILAIGNHITLWVNDVRTAELVDRQRGEQDFSGKLALQIHSMAPCKVQFRKLVLRDLGRTLSALAPQTPARRGVRPKAESGRALNLGFEDGTLADWTAEGSAFAGQPIEGDTVVTRRGDMKSEHAGRYWVGGFERLGDVPTGTLTSAAFEVTAPWASFLAAGGPHAVTCVEIVDAATGRVLFRQSGKEDESLAPVAVDLRAHQGKLIQLRLVDRHSGHWGHVNYDDFLFHPERPGDVPLIEPPPTAGQAPDQAAVTMQLADGFAVRLLASEPELKQPIAFTFDARGRVWVVEALTYPRRAAEGKGQDRILIFEDTTGDGHLDSRKVFVEGLNLVSGIEVGFAGVWVGAAPHLLFFPDADHDDRPDGECEVLLDGWGYQDTHETLNTFRWGPDGWLYGCHGVFTHSRVGKPGTADADREPINAGIWRYHPTRHEFEVFAWGTSNPWGVDFDDNGQAFATACVIPHLYHIVQGGRYQRQAGRHFGERIYDDIKTIADHRHYVGDNPHAGNQKSDSAGGGHAHCGLAIYLADQFPAEYRGHLFFHNIHGHRINSDVVEHADGSSGFVGRHGRDLMVSGDRWHLGTAIRLGPDGGLTFTDWYDQQSCHTTNSGVWDRGNGRLYAISHGKPRLARVDLRRKSDTELVQMQMHPNDWFVSTARRLLQERAARNELDAPLVDARLRRILADSDDTSRRLRALWCLHVIGTLTETDLIGLLRDREEYVRAWAIQLLGEDGMVGSDALVQLASLAKRDASLVVRLYLASLMQRLPVADRWELAEGLAVHAESRDDHNLPLMVWYGLEPLVATDPRRALRLMEHAAIPRLQRFILRCAASRPAGLAAVVDHLPTAERSRRLDLFATEILRALRENPQLPMPLSWPETRERLMSSADQGALASARALSAAFGDRSTFPDLRRVLADAAAAAHERTGALEVLVDARDDELPPILHGLLRHANLSGHPLRRDALRALAVLPHPDTATSILAAWAELTPTERATAAATLAARKDSARALLEALRAGDLRSRDLSAAVIRQLRNLGDAGIDRAVADLWGAMRETTAGVGAEIQRLKEQLKAQASTPADLSRGRRAFKDVCATCHTLFGLGGNIGPDLTGSNRGDLDYLLENILDPSAVLGRDYQLVIVTMSDGRVVSGNVAAETVGTLTIRQATGEEVLLRQDEISRRVVSPVSLMPPGLLASLETTEVRDLIEYLGSPTQVPVRADAPAIDGTTGLVPGALEGETLTLSLSAGSARPQDMSPFTNDRWSGNSHLWWTGGKAGDHLVVEFEVGTPGEREVVAAFTRARDYGIVRVWVDDDVHAAVTLDLYSPVEVVSTGPLSLGRRRLEAGKHRLNVRIEGQNPSAVPALMFGLDYLLLR